MDDHEIALPQRVDHLIFAVADLEVGRDKLESLLGVRPVLGGRHPEYGTHNAQLSLGPTTYLEVIAPDPESELPKSDVLFGLDWYEPARLKTWVLRADSIETSVAAASAVGVPLGSINAGQRVKPDGTVVSWKLTDPTAMPLSGAVPFLIHWGGTPHPARSAPGAGELVGLRIEHPEPEHVRRALDALRAEADVRFGERFQLIARIRTEHGDVEIR